MSAALSLAQLRSRIAALDGSGGDAAAGVVPVGVAEIDAVLPWGGLPLGCLHEVVSPPHPDGIADGAALGFTAFLLGRMTAAAGRPALWVAADAELYPPGLAGLGLVPERLVVVRSFRVAQALWAMEEGLRCRALAGVVAETWALDLTAARRLQLAARASGVAALVLNRGTAVGAGAAVTRWRVGSVPGRTDPVEGVGPWCWRLELLRCRGGAVGENGIAAWEVEWSEEARGLRLAAAAGDRAAVPQGRRAMG